MDQSVASDIANEDTKCSVIINEDVQDASSINIINIKNENFQDTILDGIYVKEEPVATEDASDSKLEVENFDSLNPDLSASKVRHVFSIFL